MLLADPHSHDLTFKLRLPVRFRQVLESELQPKMNKMIFHFSGHDRLDDALAYAKRRGLYTNPPASKPV